MRHPRRDIAIRTRKKLIERFGMDRSAPFVDVAQKLIAEDRLFADIPQDRGQAIEFLACYGRLSESGCQIRPLPES